MNQSLIPAFLKGEELQKQIRSAKQNGTSDALDIWWLGQSGFLVQWNKVCVLFDPYLSDSLTKKYQSTNKPHVRMSELVIDPNLLDCIDIVTSSHNHTDHLDGETLIPLLKVNPNISFIIPEANRAFIVDRVKCDFSFPVGLNDGESIELNGIKFYGVPAAHNEIERDESGKCKFMGYVARFVDITIYHSGDTLWYYSMVNVLKPFKIDIAFLPINGNDPSRGVAGNLNTQEATQLAKEINAKMVIPHHYDMFTFNTADPNDFATEAKAINQGYKILKLGERFTYTKNK
jgi:L-ascorbate metabolism protein UlaG (beta-lactamase superfamily)